MAEVSDGLLRQLRELIDDGTPRGIVWPMLAELLYAGASMIAPGGWDATDEEVEMVNESLILHIADADERALNQMEILLCVQQLEEVLKNRRGES